MAPINNSWQLDACTLSNLGHWSNSLSGLHKHGYQLYVVWLSIKELTNCNNVQRDHYLRMMHQITYLDANSYKSLDLDHSVLGSSNIKPAFRFARWEAKRRRYKHRQVLLIWRVSHLSQNNPTNWDFSAGHAW